MRKYKKKLILVSLIILLIRLIFIDYESGDYTIFLRPWVNYMRNNGGILSLKDTFTNYNLPYLTILSIISYIPLNSLLFIKIISIIFDFLIAYYGYKIIKELVNKEVGSIAYIILLLLPTVFLNSSAWGQCDSIYTCFVLMSIYFLIKNKYIKSFIFLGVAFAFKLQFVFILPVYIILFFIKKDIKLWHFFLIPLTNLILCIPGMLVGASPFYTYKIYFMQTGDGIASLNVMNPYNYIEASRYNNFIGICITMTIFFFLLVYSYLQLGFSGLYTYTTISVLYTCLMYFSVFALYTGICMFIKFRKKEYTKKEVDTILNKQNSFANFFKIHRMNLYKIKGMFINVGSSLISFIADA